MLPLLDDENLKTGFCVGIHPASVDRGHRITLPKAIIEVLEEHKVKKLWEYPDPRGRRLILCPPQYRSAYLKIARQHLPASMDNEMACRKFIHSGWPIPLRTHGRILIVHAFRGHLLVKATDDLVIFGLGGWYEIWREQEWISKDTGGDTKM
jgi:DNA-binding transcriptional regulator/RsmH inhibitor MraZ